MGLKEFETEKYLTRKTARFLDGIDLKMELPKGYTLSHRVRYKTSVVKTTKKGEARKIDVIITVPKGFPTDLASIPRIFRSIVSKDGPNRWAAIVHDYVYSLKGEKYGISRKDADKIFLEAMTNLGVSRRKRWIMHKAVRIGGWVPWKRKPRKDDPTYQDWGKGETAKEVFVND